MPSIFSRNTRPPDGSTMATAIFQLCFFISPIAASATCFAWSSPIGSPYGMSNGIVSGTDAGAWASAGAASSDATNARPAIVAFIFSALPVSPEPLLRPCTVMPVLVTGIHVFGCRRGSRGWPAFAGHDGCGWCGPTIPSPDAPAPPASLMSVPQPGPVGRISSPFSMTGGCVTSSSFQGTSSMSISMTSKFGTAAQKCALISVAEMAVVIVRRDSSPRRLRPSRRSSAIRESRSTARR